MLLTSYMNDRSGMLGALAGPSRHLPCVVQPLRRMATRIGFCRVEACGFDVRRGAPCLGLADGFKESSPADQLPLLTGQSFIGV